MLDLHYSNDSQRTDLRTGASVRPSDEELESAVLISLFSQQGWWGDAVSNDKIGSKLHEHRRKPLSEERLRLMEKDAEAALQWMVDDKVAASVKVSAVRFSKTIADMTVEIYPPGNDSPWSRLWKVSYGV